MAVKDLTEFCLDKIKPFCKLSVMSKASFISLAVSNLALQILWLRKYHRTTPIELFKVRISYYLKPFPVVSLERV